MLFIFVLVFSGTILLTGLIRYYALSNKILDIPNQRSSHKIPTPRGGGLAIVISFFSAASYLFLSNELNPAWFSALSATLLVALIGFCDDHAHVAARWRFLIHLLAAFSALYFLNGLPQILIPKPLASIFGIETLNTGWYGYFPGTLLLVWFLNLFNFMDGTDGIAASEAVFVSAALAGYLYFIDDNLFNISAALAVSAAGFLVWNRPPAKIFMGDVGSGFLGLLLGILILMAAKLAPVLFYCGLILFGIFIVDASYTLAIRFLSGQKWHQAHCSHTYQRAAKQFGHLPVLLVCWAINLFWLLPISRVVFLYPEYALPGLFLAYLPLVFLAYRFKAGQAITNN